MADYKTEGRLWVVMPSPDSEIASPLSSTPRRHGVEEAHRRAQLIYADTSKDAAEAFRCSVLDLDVGLTLAVHPVGFREGHYHREYAVKGPGWLDNRDPRTVEVS